MPIALAAAAAFCFAGAGVSMKRSFAGNSLVVTLLLSLPVVVLTTALVAALDPPEGVAWGSVWWFVAGGVVGDGIARVFYMGGVDRLGVSRSTPLQTAAYPVLALLGGVLFFSESLSIGRIAGAGLIVAGIWAVVTSDEGSPNGSRRWRWRWAYLFPVGAGLAFALSDVFRKIALEDIPSPAFGATVGAATALSLWAGITVLSPRMRAQAKVGPGWQWTLLAGLFLAIGLLAVFNALEDGDISVVGPVIVSQPLAVVVLSAVFLREHERVTWRTVVGALLTVSGVIALAFAS